MKESIVLAINPGSTSTKIAAYKDDKPLFVRNITHSSEELSAYPRLADQFEFRRQAILSAVESEGLQMSDFDAIVGRGGLVNPIESGVYEVNAALEHDLMYSPIGEHASNLGGLIAKDLASGVDNARAFIADPVVVDEMDDVARLTGHPLFARRSIFHALNHKAVGRMYAHSIGKEYADINLIICHLGGGVSVGAHRKGRVVDVNNALDGAGPFSPERSGSIPVGDLVNLCFSGKYTHGEVKKMIKGEGGLVAHLGSNEMLAALQRADAGDAYAQRVIDAFCYNVAKYVGSMSVALSGDVDAVIITGGIARSQYICDYIRDRVSFIAPVVIYPGEDEMFALAHNGLMVLRGELELKTYLGSAI